MSNPTRGDLRRLQRLGRHLVGRSLSVWSFEFQGARGERAGYTDSDWAGCRKTARSTSGGALLSGRHTLKTWSATQKNVTLSSGEAELVATVKMSCEMIGMSQLAFDWRLATKGNIFADSSAALGIAKRRGRGKMRHVKIETSWTQEKNETGELQYNKVQWDSNPADLMTKNVNRRTLDKTAAELRQHFKEGPAIYLQTASG